MSSAGAAATGAAAAAAIANATKASGVLVRVEPEDFQAILERQDEPLVVEARGGFMSGGKHQYLTTYKGLAFFTKSDEPVPLPGTAQRVRANKIWIPG